MANSNVCGIVTYNMHGINAGRSGLFELCCDPEVHIIAVQEHWLSNDDVHTLNNIHPEFAGFGISSMTEKLHKGVYRGRPYGGVGFLWRKSLCNRIHFGTKAASGRCLSIELELDTPRKARPYNCVFPVI